MIRGGHMTKFCERRIGQNISRLRKQAGLSIEELALTLGVKPSKLLHMEQVSANPKIDMLRKLKNVLKCTYADLLE